MRHPSRFGLAVTALFTLSACGGDSTTDPGDDPGLGTFSVTITGDVNAEFEGQAFFGEATDPQTQETGWVLWLTTTESQNTGRAVYFVRQDNRPGTGTYSLVDLDGGADLESGGIGAAFYDYSSQTLAGAYLSTGGTLQITESDGDGMEGTFTIQATGFLLNGQQTTEADVTITGEFDAEGGNVLYPGF